MERLINFYTEIDALARRAMPKGQRRRRTGGRADEYSTPGTGGGHAPELGGVPGAAVHAAMSARRALTGIQTDDRYIMTALGDDREYSALLAEVRRQGNADIEARAAADALCSSTTGGAWQKLRKRGEGAMSRQARRRPRRWPTRC